MRVVAIVNPAAGQGRAVEAWMNVRARLKGAVETLYTERPGHASELAAQAIQGGAETIVAVGGDGTISEVANGFFDGDRLLSDRTTLAVVPHGTGSDFVRSVRLPEDGKHAAMVIQSGRTRPLDLLKVHYTESEGVVNFRYAVNLASFGMGGLVAALVKGSSKRVGRKLSFLLATMRSAATFPGNLISISIDGSKAIETRIANVAVGNGQYHGGGMRPCPRAKIDDGVFDVTLIEFLPVLQIVRNIRLLYNGQIYRVPEAKFFRATRLRAESKESVLLEVDGESLGRLPVEVTVVPHAIRILTP